MIGGFEKMEKVTNVVISYEASDRIVMQGKKLILKNI